MAVNRIGSKIGLYTLAEKIATHGEIDIYRGVVAVGKDEAAVHLLPPRIAENPDLFQRFYREMGVAARLEHPRLLSVFGYGRHEGLAYIVTRPYPAGGTLAGLIKRSRGGLPIKQVVRLTAQIAEGLDYMHGQNAVHADLTPHSILLDEEYNVSLGDIRLAEILREPGSLPGTPAYLAPELASSARTSHLADIYSLGVILFEMLTGQLPFHGDTPKEIMEAQARQPVPSILNFRSDAPGQVQYILAQAMTKNPAERFQSARMVATELEQIVGTALRTSFHAPSLRTGPLDPSAVGVGPSAASTAMDVSIPRPATRPWKPLLQLTVYAPREIPSRTWNRLTVYIHLPERLKDVEADLLARASGRGAADRGGSGSEGSLPPKTPLRIVPYLPGCVVNPPDATVLWMEGWHGVEFRMAALPDVPGFAVGHMLSGWVLLLAGPLVMAAARIWALVMNEGELSSDTRPTRVTVDPFRAVYVCYAPQDADMAAEVEKASRMPGMDFLQDLVSARASGQWSAELGRRIDEADAFQLCWSAAAERSALVEQEWRFAANLDRAGFIWPVFRERPLLAPPGEMAGLPFVYHDPVASGEHVIVPGGGEALAEAPHEARARLVSTEQPETAFPISGRTVVVGRSDAYKGSVDIDLTDLDPTNVSSRQHAQILEREGRFYIHDLNSLNGTLVNGMFVKPGERRELRHGDVIQFGNQGVMVEFREDE